MSFNIFKILEKDDKELIHSAFIKFLLCEFEEFSEEFTGNKITDNSTINLEKGYRYKKRKNGKSSLGRFDIEILTNDSITIIENKFKSFPLSTQLKEYNQAIEKIHPELKSTKILLCFDKNMVKNNESWKVFDLIPIIENLKNKTKDNEKKIFINHYLDFLNEYYETYKNLHINILHYIKNQKDKKNKFWVSLIYSNLAVRFEQHFISESIDVKILANTGNTKTPIINIIPKHWNINGKELLIQIQDGKVKFYAHTGDKLFLHKIREFVKSKVKNDSAKIKKDTKGKYKSESIATFDLIDKIGHKQKLSADELFNFILIFYEKIDTEIIKNYS
ncbi:hypothetical protein [Tenacibaculum maritimum]|uniref:hypothetical protein n=1 Tax=Tenacibaculum maritimum TaxID=107401 RepID=UPI0038776C1B